MPCNFLGEERVEGTFNFLIITSVFLVDIADSSVQQKAAPLLNHAGLSVSGSSLKIVKMNRNFAGIDLRQPLYTHKKNKGHDKIAKILLYFLCYL